VTLATLGYSPEVLEDIFSSNVQLSLGLRQIVLGWGEKKKIVI